jgi:hypothetical protein
MLSARTVFWRTTTWDALSVEKQEATFKDSPTKGESEWNCSSSGPGESQCAVLFGFMISFHTANSAPTPMESKGETPKTEGGPKSLLLMVSLVTVLSLATWLFFHVESMPLSPPETTVVVGGWFIIIFLGKLIWRRVRRRRV